MHGEKNCDSSHGNDPFEGLDEDFVRSRYLSDHCGSFIEKRSCDCCSGVVC